MIKIPKTISGSIKPLPPTIDTVSLSSSSINTTQNTTLTAKISNMVTTDDIFAEINGVVFKLTSTDGYSWTKVMNGIDIGTVTSGTMTIYAINSAASATNTSLTLTVTSADINANTFIHDALIYIRNLILNNITDPSSAKRPSTSKFAATAWPERDVVYPLILVELALGPDERLGVFTQDSSVKLNFRISVWARDTKTRDTLSDSVYDLLRTSQNASTTAVGLYNFALTNTINIDELGKEGLHRKIMFVQYTYLT